MEIAERSISSWNNIKILADFSGKEMLNYISFS
jgi:hypothetical protein